MNSIYTYANNLVFAKNIQKGINFLDNLIGELKYKEVKNVIKDKNGMFVELHNGETYKVVLATLCSRGHRCDKAYIEKGIDEEILNKVIYPCLSHCKIPTDMQIIWFE